MLSLPLSLSLHLLLSSAKTEEQMGHNSLGRDGSLEVSEREVFSKVLARWFLLWGIFLGTPSPPPSPRISPPTLNCQSWPMASPAYPPINSRSHTHSLYLEFLTTCNWTRSLDYNVETNTSQNNLFVHCILKNFSNS